jgi:hypothetical protein
MDIIPTADCWLLSLDDAHAEQNIEQTIYQEKEFTINLRKFSSGNRVIELSIHDPDDEENSAYRKIKGSLSSILS